MAATTDSQKQLLSLIRNFATEKSQGEKRVFNLKKRIEELQSEVESANYELDNAKRFKETTEQDLRGYEVEFSMSAASIQTLETRNASIQDEISKVGMDVDDLKNKEAARRDEFIHRMLEFKGEIRKFQDITSSSLQQANGQRTSSVCKQAASGNPEVSGLDKISNMVAQTAAEEKVCGREQLLNNELHQELIDCRGRLELIETVIKVNKELQELTRLTSELEEKCAFSGEELQRRCLCPICHLDNSEALAELLQETEHN